MTMTNINIRVDSEIKQQAETIFNELGINMSTAMNMFLRRSIYYGGIPFDLRVNSPNEITEIAIDDINNNFNISESFDSIDALMDDLNA